MLTDHFVRRLDRGKKCEELVADLLASQGVNAVPTKWGLARHKGEIVQFKDEIDLLVNGLPVDVKSRTISFTSQEDYPYPTAFVDTVSGWEAKKRKPVAIILYSEPTGGTLVIRPSTRDSWTSQRRFDRDAGYSDDFYLVNKELLTSLDEFVLWLTAGRI